MATLLRIAILFCSLLCCPVTRANSPCPLLGPDVPAPVLPSSSHAFGLIKQNLTSAIQKVLAAIAASGHNANSTSFSVDVWSAHDEISLFTFHYSAPALANPAEGVATVDSTTIYRIGSISKLLTVYTFLVQAGDSSFNLPITKYVPELTENGAHWETTKEVDDVDWSSITVGALASQMAGIFRDFAPGPTSDAELAKYGLPPVPSINVSYCGDIVPTPCDRADFFVSFLAQRPVVAPFWTPIYSNAAFQILAYALENMTGQAFPSLLTSQILKPLNMTSTFASTPASSNKSIIPINASTSRYSLDTGDSAPAGGFYSSIDDLRTLGISIINSTLLSTAQSRRWMKPVTFTADPNVAVGAPWEIARAPTSDARAAWMYTKGGQLGLYKSQIALLPDWDAGFTVLGAGLESSQIVDALSGAVATIIVPALELAAKEEAMRNFAGFYMASEERDGMDAILTLIVDSGPGLRIASWILNGTDAFELISELIGAQAANASSISIRLYPTGLKTVDSCMTFLSFRAIYEFIDDNVPNAAYCASWMGVDSLEYSGVGVDEWLFGMDPNGVAVSLQPRAIRLILDKQIPIV